MEVEGLKFVEGATGSYQPDKPTQELVAAGQKVKDVKRRRGEVSRTETSASERRGCVWTTVPLRF
ncbi:hypothetical protein D4764_01G0020390 [Takifugu flavidus]|uniref:Uncharacterized protein n=1 Tax=Takifugu flavidus TaxID=433684 RepID=A0A5C6PRC2_9TELE|nr:hypothetical protein D4764_01G0020390 [Takifugu flavidus]